MSVPQPGDDSALARTCRACTTRECCTRPVELTIAELGAIARTLELPPRLFAELSGESKSPTLHLIRDAGTCVFLLHLASHKRLCGLGPLAPLACRRFPTRPDPRPHCWRTWTDDERDAPDLDAEAHSARTSQAAHVARWQTRLASRAHRLNDAMVLDALLSLAAEPNA